MTAAHKRELLEEQHTDRKVSTPLGVPQRAKGVDVDRAWGWRDDEWKVFIGFSGDLWGGGEGG
jgi:hypothetical protein